MERGPWVSGIMWYSKQNVIQTPTKQKLGWEVGGGGGTGEVPGGLEPKLCILLLATGQSEFFFF